MTVCIAAICENGKYIVVAADRMFTSSLNVEFETDERKIEVLGKSCVALAAGNTAYSSEILGLSRTQLGQRDEFPVAEAAKIIKEIYIFARNQKVEETVVIPAFGKYFLDFRNKGASLAGYLQPQQNTFSQITSFASQYVLDLELLIAGIDDTGAHIYQVSNPGTEYALDKLGHAAVGSGGLHAIIYLSLIGQTSHKGLAETLYSLYDAKKAAEVAPGVGSVTDIAIVEKDKIWDCPDSLLVALESVSSEARKRTLPDLKEVREAYDKCHQ
jgi:20S proteasome alpha/beta subunit